MAKTVLITGASGGIGYELALLFARDGFDCVITARSEDKLTELADRLRRDHGIAVQVLARDLAKPGTPAEIWSTLEAAKVEVDILVNNAGFPTYGLFAELDAQAELDELQVNVVALTHLTKLFLPGMIARRDGRILNLASLAAFEPGPLMAVYYATKAYVLSFSEALANELIGTGVSVTTLCPGLTRTGFQARGAMEDSRLVQGEMADAASVALAGYRAVMGRKGVVIPGLRNKLVALGVKLTPRSLVTPMVRRAQERR
ncbi:MAG: SDR family oxidoreductase [Candidatus Dormibacteria bacterium]